MKIKGTLPHAIAVLSEQLNIDKQIIWDMLQEEIFLTSMFGYRLKRTGVRKIIIREPDGREFYVPFEGLSGGQQTFAIVDILLKFLRADCRNPPWLVAFDSGFFLRLDSDRQGLVFNKITANTDFPLQAIFVVNSETEAESLKVVATDNWIGVNIVDGLTVLTFL